MSDRDNEVDVPINRFDMDHLSEGQPVFKQGSGDTRLVLRFDGSQEWGIVPIEDLRELVEEWREGEGEVNTAYEAVYKKCADELEETIEGYE